MKKSNIFLVIKAIRKINKKKPKMFVYGCIEAVLEVSQSYIQLLLLPLIITSFSKGEVNSFICACALYFIIPFTSGIIAKVFCGKRVIHEIEMSEDTVNNVHNKLLKIPFNSFSNEEIKEQYEVALDELYYEFDYSDLVEKEIAIIKNILSLSFSIIFVISMVCTIPTIISNKLMFSISQPIVTTVIYAITFMLLLLLNKRVQNKAIKKHKVLLDKHAKVEKRLFYLQNEIVYDFNNYISYGLFNMGKMLGSRFDENKKENVDFFSDIKNITIKTRSSRSLFSGLSYLFCFIITLIKTISGAIEASLFVSYMQSSSRAFEEAISLHDNYGSIKQQLHYFDNIEAVMNLQEEINEGKSITIDKKHRFQFSHVYYKYPNATDYALEDINIEFGDKDNIALVGENGSGKTTLLMLLYRLIVPEKGIITIDGIDIQTINIFEYRKLFSSMLQETDVYPFSRVTM